MCQKPTTCMGTVIVSVRVASLTGTLGWIAIQSSTVPSLQIELRSLGKAINLLIVSTEKQSDRVLKQERVNTAQHQQIITVMRENSIRVNLLEKECDRIKGKK